mmetsp:Transcript_6547/g.5629  ORF Transcript_6547/g.5629 Transcript_6547/m.5629 type:complete len:82 (+) Transcript_6547:955-1200(+)
MISNKMRFSTDEEVFQSLVGETTNVQGYRAKHDNKRIKSLLVKLTEWGMQDRMNSLLKNQKSDYFENRPNKIKKKIRYKVS